VLSEGYKQSQWRKSSFSGNGDCVECNIDSEGVQVRDSNSPSGIELYFSRAVWKIFVAAVKAGRQISASLANRQNDSETLDGG
jgi:Domain of unknown function (DUF397)